MKDVERINGLLAIDQTDQLAENQAGFVCDTAVSLGGRFNQSPEGRLFVEEVFRPPQSRLAEHMNLMSPTREVAPEFASIPFNPEIVTFISFKDGLGQPKPGIPILPHHKLETVAETKYDRFTALELGRIATDRISGMLNKVPHRPHRELYLTDRFMIKADKLRELVPILEEYIANKRSQRASGSQGEPSLANVDSWPNWMEERRSTLDEALVDTLSMCAGRLILEHKS